MFNKKDDKKKVPQVEIDGESYHETAEVAFGIVKEVIEVNNHGNIEKKLKFKLKKYIIVPSKKVPCTVLREEDGLAGKVLVQNQLEIEVRKEVKRLVEDV